MAAVASVDHDTSVVTRVAAVSTSKVQHSCCHVFVDIFPTCYSRTFFDQLRKCFSGVGGGSGIYSGAQILSSCDS